MNWLGSIGHGTDTIYIALFTELYHSEPCYWASVNGVYKSIMNYEISILINPHFNDKLRGIKHNWKMNALGYDSFPCCFFEVINIK